MVGLQIGWTLSKLKLPHHTVGFVFFLSFFKVDHRAFCLSTATCWSSSSNGNLLVKFLVVQRLLWTAAPDIFSDRKTGVLMRGLGKHNLIRITNALLHFSSNFREISYELSLLSALLILINCLQNSEIPAVYGH